MALDNIDRAVSELRHGRAVVVVDAEDRENEGDLIMAAEHVSESSVAFFLEHTSGFLCAAITDHRARELKLPPMVVENTESHRTAFLVSVDARGTGTGISAGDRATTIRALVDPATQSDDLARPGHVLPLQARPGGVLERPGHTEAGIDLCRLAGLAPAALLCELVSADRRTMMRGEELVEFARRHDMPIISIAALAEYRRERTGLVRRVSEASLPSGGDFAAICYRSTSDGVEHIAMTLGSVGDGGDTLVRIHSECLTGDVFRSERCDCGAQLEASMNLIRRRGRGVLIYVRGHEGRGIGLGRKLLAYQLQQRLGLDTVDANLQLGLPVDLRDYSVAAHVLADLGVCRVQLITNNPDKVAALTQHGLTVVERIPIRTPASAHNVAYLRTKRDRMGHDIDVTESAPAWGPVFSPLGGNEGPTSHSQLLSATNMTNGIGAPSFSA